MEISILRRRQHGADLLIAKRAAAAVLRFFRKAIRHHGRPEVVTID